MLRAGDRQWSRPGRRPLNAEGEASWFAASSRPRARALIGPTLTLALVLAWLAAPALANPIGPNSTGNVEKDFVAGQPGITTLVNPRYPTVNPEKYIADNQLSPGWSIKDVRVSYDKATDTLDVGLNFFGIAGDADGNGDPGTVSTAAQLMGAKDVANLGGRESITVGFDVNGDGRPDFLAGVPGDKSQAGPGTDGFTFASYQSTGLGLANSYGQPLTTYLGNLQFNPSATHPDFEFTVKNFSKLPGYNPKNGYGLMAFAGTPDDIYEEEGVLFPRVSAGEIPEPASLLAWATLVAGGALWGRHRRGQKTPASRPTR